MADAAEGKPSVEYRWVNGPTASQEDWDAIEAVLKDRGWSSLNRETTRIRIAEEDGALVGFVVLQLFPHLEPLYVDPAHRGSGIAEQLADDITSFMVEIKARAWEVVADSPHAEKLCKREGMTLVPHKVYRAS